MTNQIDLKELISFVSMYSTAIYLGSIRIGSIVKDVCAIAKTNESNVRHFLCAFCHDAREKICWDHSEVLVSKKM